MAEHIVNIIKKLREREGLTQQKLADELGVSRSSLSQIENGERRITINELIKLSKIFNTTSDILLGLKKDIEITVTGQSNSFRKQDQIRINVPQKNLEKFKEILLYILSKVGSKPNIGETVLYKLLYFIDFNYYEKYEEQLIGATYQKNHYGPTPVEFKIVIKSMIIDKSLEKIDSKYYKFRQQKYLPLRKADLSLLKANEIEVINNVLSRLSDMNASEISDYSHNDVPWLTTEDGGIIEYESVFYRTPMYSVREN